MVVEPGAFRTDFAGRSLHQAEAAIADYADTAGRRRKENDTMHGTQPGDPARAAQALLDVVAGSSLPFRLLLGKDAVSVIGDEVDAQRREIDEWSHVSTSTDFLES